MLWKKMQKTNEKEFRIGKRIERKDNKLYIKWITVGLIKKNIFIWNESFSRNKGECEIDLSNNTTKSDVTGVDPSQFAKNATLAGLKSELDKLGIDELKTYQKI